MIHALVCRFIVVHIHSISIWLCTFFCSGYCLFCDFLKRIYTAIHTSTKVYSIHTVYLYMYNVYVHRNKTAYLWMCECELIFVFILRNENTTSLQEEVNRHMHTQTIQPQTLVQSNSIGLLIKVLWCELYNLREKCEFKFQFLLLLIEWGSSTFIFSTY